MSEKASSPPAEAPTPATKKGGAADTPVSAGVGRAGFRLGIGESFRFDVLPPALIARSMPPAPRQSTLNPNLDSRSNLRFKTRPSDEISRHPQLVPRCSETVEPGKWKSRRLLTVKQAPEQLCVCAATVYRLSDRCEPKRRPLASHAWGITRRRRSSR
jgi:hypothetical protein